MSSCRIVWRWRLCFVSVAVVLLTALYLLSSLPALPELTEIDTCPACFGTSLCSAVHKGLLSLEDPTSFPGIATAFGVKNVFFGFYEGRQVVIKKLGHAWELNNLDRALCLAADLNPDCKIKEAVDYLSDIHSLIMDYVSQSTKDSVGILSNFHLCPSTDNLDLLLSNIMKHNKNVSSHLILIHIWTLLHLNAEPIVLQILPTEEGWPVPKYIGACGRLVVEEFAGRTLSDFVASPWPVRAALSKQLLAAALRLTDEHPHFRFYLTDVSLDNVAVDSEGNIKFIDLENIVIVDKYPSERVKPTTWDIPHVSENYGCKDCFAFSTNDLCNHHISDHNLYAICQELLIGGGYGLLAHIPAAAFSRHPELTALLQQCAYSPGVKGRRVSALKLISALKTEASYTPPLTL